MVYSIYRHQEQESNSNLQPYHISYYDHVSSGDTKQYFGAVLTHFETLFLGLKRILPHARNLYIQYDHSWCYKTASLVLGFFRIDECHGFTLMCYIHTIIQNGKGSVDAHFAIAVKRVD